MLYLALETAHLTRFGHFMIFPRTVRYLVANTTLFLNTLRSVLTSHIIKAGTVNIFLLLVLTLITFYPLLSGGFTTHDDASFAINVWSGQTWEFTKAISAGEGRFSFLWAFPFSAVPYVIDNRLWYLAVKYGAVVLLLSALYYSIFKIFKSSWTALTAVALYLAIIQNGWEHNALTSYPFVFNAYAALFLVSLGLFASAIERNSLSLAYLSGVLYFFSMGSELFVLFFPFYVALMLMQIGQKESILKRLNTGKKYIFAVALPLIIYLACYFIWRRIHPSNYEGLVLNEIDLLAIIRVILTYSLTAFPLASLHFYHAPGDPLLFTSSTNLHVLLSQLNISHFIKPAASGLLFARLMIAAKFNKQQSRTFLIGAALAGIGIFIPNLLLGLTARHQSWVGGGTYSYVYTYYSFISAIIFLALLLAYINAKSLLWLPKYRAVMVSTTVIIIMILSFFVEVRNQNFAFDQKLAHRKWQLMDVLINSRAFMEIPDGARVLAPTLLPNRGYAFVSLDDWQSYVKYKTNKRITFSNGPCEEMKQCYTLVFRQRTDSDGQFIVFGKVRPPGSSDSTELTIYSMPTQSSSVIIGSFISGNVSPKLEINGIPITNNNVDQFSTIFPVESQYDLFQVASLKSNVDIIPERITIAQYNVQPQLRSVADELADGINFKMQDYPDFLAEVSGMSAAEQFGRWTDANGGSMAKFRFKQPLPKQFEVEIIVSAAFDSNLNSVVKLQVGNVEKSITITPQHLMVPFHVKFKTDGLADTLKIIPFKPTSPNEIDPKNPDTRKLGIGLTSLKIKNVY